MQLIILAAGKGSRLPEKYRYRPKCLVKINNREIINYNLNFFKKFNKKLIITGYKSTQLKSFIKRNKFKEIYNKNFATTNMVYSMFLAKKFINDDIVVVYGDVIFSENIFKLLKKRQNIIPANINWYKNWIGRMGKVNTLKDAENFELKKNKLLEIGKKLKKNNLPELQFMGIAKITLKNFKNLYSLFKSNKDNKIDFTKFINLSIKEKKIIYHVKKYKDIWYEIDSAKDIKFANKNLK
jgi:choline kinase